MFRGVAARVQGGCVAAWRAKSTKARRTPPVTWSDGDLPRPWTPIVQVPKDADKPKSLPDGGIQYYGFTYYPRFPGGEEAPVDPAPLHLVTRVRCLKKKPWWERDIMREIGLHKKRSDVTILKNNPENNAKLWKVKHLVKVTPIRLPQNLPPDADPKACFLKETGEFIYSEKLKIPDSALEEDPKQVALKWTRGFVDRETRKNWEYPWQLKLC